MAPAQSRRSEPLRNDRKGRREDGPVRWQRFLSLEDRIELF
jgi:hypothetical protein